MKSDLVGIRSRLGLATRSISNRVKIKLKDLQDARQRQAGMSVEERRAELIDFYDHFENFVEALCDAAQYGATPRLTEVYARERTWLAEKYDGLRPMLLGYLRSADQADADAISAVLVQPDLESFLRTDDGLMITRITYGREALSLYADHLRQLAA